MILSHKYKCIIINIPKTGGSSFNSLFYDLDPDARKSSSKINGNEPPYGHMTASEIRSRVGDKIYDEYFKFTFIRNPYDWFKSYYLHRLSTSKFDKTYPVRILLEDYNYQLPPPIKGEITVDHFMRCYSMGKYWLNQTGIVSNTGNIEVGDFSQLGWIDDEVDYIGLFDDLNGGLEFIKNKLGLPKETYLHHKNKAHRSDTYLNSDVMQLISTIFKDDIEFYNQRVISNKDFDANKIIKKKMNRKIKYRYDLINKLIKDNSFTRYLEIGVCYPSKCFNKINCKHKDSVDPGYENPNNPVKFKMTSDEFFNSLKPNHPKYDIIFIDGLHISWQVEKDIKNSLKYLNDDGYIIIHDSSPPSVFHARENYLVNGETPPWNGTTWKALYWVRTHRKDLHTCVVDMDFGLGVIMKNKDNNTNLIPFKNPYYEYNIMNKNRKEDLGLIDKDDLDGWINSKK